MAEKAPVKTRWLDGSKYLEANELAKSGSFRDKVRQTSRLERAVRNRESERRAGGVD